MRTSSSTISSFIEFVSGWQIFTFPRFPSVEATRGHGLASLKKY